MKVRVRIAPSPTGDPHVGTAYMAIFNRALAQKHGGRFILRIEDTDRERANATSEAQIFESLKWLGLTYDEGPDVGGPFGPYRQSERRDIYVKYTEELVAKGSAYRCFCPPDRLEAVRKAQQAGGRQPKYDGNCRNLPPEEVQGQMARGIPHVVRLKVPTTGETKFTDQIRGEIVFANDVLDDQVLLKAKDGMPTYHLANVVDDHLMEITHVIRAEEWVPSTPKHILLYQAFGWTAPEFAHFPLLRNQDRSKISKRKNPTSLTWYRDQGFLPEALVNFLALLGFSMPGGEEVFDFAKIVEHFDFSRINTTGPVFDLQKLEWLNGVYIRRLPPDDLAKRLTAWGVKVDGPRLAKMMPLVQERLKRLSEFPGLADFMLGELPAYDAALLVPKKGTPEQARKVLEAAEPLLKGVAKYHDPAIEQSLRAQAEALGLKVGDFFMTLRVAVTGKTASPPLLETMDVLGRDAVLGRLAAARAKLQ